MEKGRVYRLAPKKSKYKVEAPDYSSIESLIELLQNPNRAIHFKAFMALKEMGVEAKEALEELYASEDSRMKARAFWLLSKLPNGEEYIRQAAADDDENIRVAAVRASRMNKLYDPSFLPVLAADPSDQVRREVAIASDTKRLPKYGLNWRKAIAAETAGTWRPWASRPNTAGTAICRPTWPNWVKDGAIHLRPKT
ncbi:HEAT repeat domain-containing protein [Algoriphagus boritolerans]|uniref:HEAT repeat domain-containing protein n=1 Tax=Algoriphagus boritolerans TaxID=308111 RepID=UPI002FCE5A57